MNDQGKPIGGSEGFAPRVFMSGGQGKSRMVGGPAGGGMKDGTVDFRSRSPAEIGEQLLRDAQSLELTGASFEKDEQFYRNVAANVREAAAFLAQWHDLVESMHRAGERREGVARDAAYADCAGIAGQIRDIVHERPSVASESWRAAAAAILYAISAQHVPAPQATAAPEKHT